MSDILARLQGIDVGLAAFLILGAGAFFIIASQCFQMCSTIASPPVDIEAAPKPVAPKLPRAPSREKNVQKSEASMKLALDDLEVGGTAVSFAPRQGKRSKLAKDGERPAALKTPLMDTAKQEGCISP